MTILNSDNSTKVGIDEEITDPSNQPPTKALVCYRSYPQPCQCRRYGPRAINPCDAVDRQLVELSPMHHRASHRAIVGLAEPHTESRPLTHEEKREIARLTGTHYGPVTLGTDPETGDEQPDNALPGYRYRHPYVSREASGAIPVPTTPPLW